jgi:hypothetical protein
MSMNSQSYPPLLSKHTCKLPPYCRMKIHLQTWLWEEEATRPKFLIRGGQRDKFVIKG